MKIWYDTEFIEDGRTIELVSIGMVTEDGREYYAVSEEWPPQKMLANDWLMANVATSLPILIQGGRIMWDDGHPDRNQVKPRSQIADEVRRFIQATPDVELWAWYGAYDHVVLCQLWGRMIDLPKGVPMWTNDLKQECQRLGNPRMPEQSAGGEHNALADAMHNRRVAKHLDALVGTSDHGHCIYCCTCENCARDRSLIKGGTP